LATTQRLLTRDTGRVQCPDLDGERRSFPGEALVRLSRSGAAAHRQCESAVCVAQNVEAIVSESLQFRA
jgi:hypothetical protein